MTEQSTPPAQSEPKLKALIVQGIIGAIALAGTTAIPLIVTRMLEQPAAPVAAPSAAPAPEATMVESSTVQPAVTVPAATAVEQRGNGNGKDKPKKAKD